MRDKYLAIYQAIMFSMENLCFESLISVSRHKDGVSNYYCNFIRLILSLEVVEFKVTL